MESCVITKKKKGGGNTLRTLGFVVATPVAAASGCANAGAAVASC